MSNLSQTLTYTEPGVYTVTIPEGVYSVEIALWGAGGAAGAPGSSYSVQVGQRQVGTRVIGQELVSPARVESISEIVNDIVQRSVDRVVYERQDRVVQETAEIIVSPGSPGYVIPGGSRTVTDPGKTVVTLPEGVTTARVTATGGSGSGTTSVVNQGRVK